MPFDDLQPVEYGWVPPIYEDGRHHGLATRRSIRAFLLTEMLRADQHPRWLRDTGRLLASQGKLFGTPMDYARMEMSDFRKLEEEVRIVSRLRHPFGVAHPNLLNDPIFGGKGEKMIWTAENMNSSWFWWPKTDYNTEVFKVSENLVRSGTMRLLIAGVFANSPNNDWDLLPQSLRDRAQEMIDALVKEKGVYSVQIFVWLPWSMEPEMAGAQEYNDECESYQASQAGRKAKRLLLENLTPQQQEDYFKKGWFFVVPPSKKPMHERNIYTIERSYPNGNIHSVRRKKLRFKATGETGEFWVALNNFCFHTEEPHAIDDILLAQKLMLEHDEANFVKEANITKVRVVRPLEYSKRSV